jgi:uncharacterized membrane protein YdbT with pleckstrin-like domain
MRKLPFQLQKGEKIIKEIKPLPVLQWYFFLRSFLVIFFVLIWFIWIFFLVPMFSLIGLLIIGACLVLIFLISRNMYHYQYYWITNKRVIYRRGILGYTISSIPLERISDVIVTRTFLERIFGFGSVLVQSLAGQITYQRLGAEGSLLAVPDPEGTQRLIFEMIRKKRKEEKLTM